MKFFAQLAGLLFILIGNSAARADILFIDLNKSHAEMAAAKKSAQSLGENFIPITTSVAQSMTDASIVEAISAHKQRRPGQPLRIVISGHHAKGKFWGANGEMSMPDVASRLDKLGIAQDVTSLFFASCYRVDLGDSLWNKEYFPNALVIGGYRGKGWMNDVPKGIRYLQSFMSSVKKLEQAQSAKQAATIVRALDGWDANRSACVVRDTWIDHKNQIELRSAKATCKTIRHSGLENVVECHFQFKPECPEVPENTQKSPLREHYEYLISTRHCDDFYPKGERMGLESLNRLIFDREVRKHLERNFSHVLPDIDEALRKFGVKRSLAGFGQLSRFELYDRVDEAIAVLDGKCIGAKRSSGGWCRYAEDPKYNLAVSQLYAIRELLERPTCTPATWTTEINLIPRHVADKCGFHQKQFSGRAEAQQTAVGERGAKMLSNLFLTEENVYRLRPFVEQMKNAYPQGGKPDRQRYKNADDHMYVQTLQLLDQIPEVAQVEQMEMERLRAEGRADLATPQKVKVLIAKRYQKLLRDQYGVPDLPAETSVAPEQTGIPTN